RVIDFYHREAPFYEFCNFYASPVCIADRTWPTTEHYFQASKFQDKTLQRRVQQCASPREAFNMARSMFNQVRPDWEHGSKEDREPIKERVMYQALKAKFTQHPRLLVLLLSTGNCLIREHTPNDTYWGDGGGNNAESGKNRLGVLLMRLR
ncbi:hypothetical protein BJ684DRAFT_3234, partial [Piptocephalis cylindrospora]